MSTHLNTPYWKAWNFIKVQEKCSTQEAMRKAQDRWPELYQEFLANLPSGSI